MLNWFWENKPTTDCFAIQMIYNTLLHGEHAFRDVILVTLGCHMCSHCLSMLKSLFSDWKNDKYTSGNRLSQGELRTGEPTFGRNVLIPPQTLDSKPQKSKEITWHWPARDHLFRGERWSFSLSISSSGTAISRPVLGCIETRYL